MVIENVYVSKRTDKGKEYGAIWSLPPDLIGKKVVILTEDEWKFIKQILELFYKALQNVINEYHRNMIRIGIERILKT